ncbi:hypothetical protein FNF28_06423 [Cafeteria roenbergensis]|nr:hypothetical protein FNF28_06423 [Cafeteria roenbergensis]
MAAVREAVYVLTGWKVDLRVAPTGGEPTHVRLRSVFFSEESHCLDFAIPPAGSDGADGADVQMLDTELARDLPLDLTAYLSVCHSIPAFLSAVTLAQFEKQTQTMGVAP